MLPARPLDSCARVAAALNPVSHPLPMQILDEANASVDLLTEAAMDAVVAGFVAGKLGPVTCQPRTLLVIAHRLVMICIRSWASVGAAPPRQQLHAQGASACAPAPSPPGTSPAQAAQQLQAPVRVPLPS